MGYREPEPATEPSGFDRLDNRTEVALYEANRDTYRRPTWAPDEPPLP